MHQSLHAMNTVPFIACRHHAGVRLSDAALAEYNARVGSAPINVRERRKFHNEYRWDAVMAQVVTDLGSRANGKGAVLGVWYVDAAHKVNPDTSDYDVWMAVVGKLLQ